MTEKTQPLLDLRQDVAHHQPATGIEPQPAQVATAVAPACRAAGPAAKGGRLI
jgi:hypothetical protein